MLEMVVYAERVPKISKGDMWRKTEVLRWDGKYISWWITHWTFSIWANFVGFSSDRIGVESNYTVGVCFENGVFKWLVV